MRGGGAVRGRPGEPEGGAHDRDERALPLPREERALPLPPPGYGDDSTLWRCGSTGCTYTEIGDAEQSWGAGRCRVHASVLIPPGAARPA